jgi:type 1 glutamine amidotransferase
LPKKALILAGDHWHSPNVAADGIGPDLTAEGLGFEFSTEYQKFGRSMLREHQLFILHRSGLEFSGIGDQDSEPWMRSYQEDVIENYVLGGGGFLAFHNAAWGYPWQGAYRRVLGGYFIGHPPVAEFTVNVVNPDHPVTKNVISFTVTDEQHWLWFDYDRVELLLVNQGQDGRQSAAGWAYDYGKGRVVYLANGHTIEVHRHPQFVQLKRNAIRWLLRMGELVEEEHPLD